MQILAQIEPFVYEWTSRHRGSISAEHGLGLMKAEKIYYSKPSQTVSLLRSIQRFRCGKRGSRAGWATGQIVILGTGRNGSGWVDPD